MARVYKPSVRKYRPGTARPEIEPIALAWPWIGYSKQGWSKAFPTYEQALHWALTGRVKPLTVQERRDLHARPGYTEAMKLAYEQRTRRR